MSISGRRALIIGSVGAIIAGVASLLWFLDGLRYLNFYWNPNFYWTWYFLWVGWGQSPTLSVLGVGIILAGVSYRNYRIRTGTASFALGIVAGASFVISPMVSYFGYTYIAGDFFHHPWNILFAILALMTLVLFGVMQIVWGIAHIKSRKYTASRLAIVTGTMLIASGPLTVSTYAGPLLFFVSQILTIIFFLTPKMPQRARMSEIDFACKILGKAPDEIAKGNMDEIRAMVALALRHRVHRKRGSIPMIIRRLTLLNAFWIRNGRMVKDPYGGIPGPLRTEIESYTKERKSWVLGKIKK